RLRRKALAGDPAAVPPSRLVVDAARAPEANDLPITLEWRRRPRSREWLGPLFFCVASISFLGVEVGPALFGGPLGGVDPCTRMVHELETNASGLVLDIFFGLLVLTFAVLGLAALVSVLTTPLGPAYGVIADDAGISALRFKGQRPRLPWRDIRLV